MNKLYALLLILMCLNVVTLSACGGGEKVANQNQVIQDNSVEKNSSYGSSTGVIAAVF
jgi:hypothetical protein